MPLFDKINLTHIADLIKEGLKQGNLPDEFAKVPEGDYHCTVEKLEARMTRESQKPMAVWELIILNDGDFEGRHVWVNQILEADTPEKTIKSWARFKRTLAVFLGGYEIDDVSEITEDLIEDYILGQQCVLKVKNMTTGGGQFMTIGPVVTEE